MAAHSLVVKFASLEAIETAITTAHDDVVSQVDDLLSRADAQLAGWNASTASRIAETGYRQDVLDGVERLAEALERVRRATADVAEKAHTAEVRNVAIMD